MSEAERKHEEGGEKQERKKEESITPPPLFVSLSSCLELVGKALTEKDVKKWLPEDDAGLTCADKYEAHATREGEETLEEG